MGSHIALWVLSILAFQGDPPPGLVRKVAEREVQSEAARGHYLYRQTVTIEEIDPQGRLSGDYREQREVIFTPAGERLEQLVGKPASRLSRLVLTEEDFEDIRNIQPLLLTTEMLARYDVKFRGDETAGGLECWVLDIRPRQIFEGMRLFEGLAWVEKKSLSIVRTSGQAVPPVYSRGRENLFPRFTTIREQIDGEHWFPVLTVADDVLPFKSGGQRMKLTIRYSGYKRFGAESKITFK